MFAMSLPHSVHALEIGWFNFLHNYISTYHYCYCHAATFTEVPSTQVVGVGQEAVFICRNPTASGFGWIWNGSDVRTVDPPGITTDDNVLTIVAQSDYNETEVVCVAFFISGGSNRTTPVRLLIQGTESAPIDIRH